MAERLLRLMTTVVRRRKVDRERKAAARRLPIVRNSDPDSSHVAAAAYEPNRDSAKGRVLAYMRERLDEWFDAIELTNPDVGGASGKRRMRELRTAGYPIDGRQKPGSPNTWQHCLRSEAP